MASTHQKMNSLILTSALLLQFSFPALAADLQSDPTIQTESSAQAATDRNANQATWLDPDVSKSSNIDASIAKAAETQADAAAKPETETRAEAPETFAKEEPFTGFAPSKELLASSQLAAVQPEPTTDAILRGGVSSDPVVAGKQVDDLTRQILIKLIELERFNLHYTLEVAKQGRWKGWRYAFFQEINTGTGLAGSIISTVERGSHLHSPGSVSRVVQQRANIVPMIGSIIGAGAAAMEFGINEYHDVVARSKGFAPKTARLHVAGIKADIDRLMAQREALLKVEETSSALQARAHIDEAETKVLNDLRDECVMEFERYQIGARKIFAFQQSQYFFDCTKYTLNAIGSYFAYKSLHDHDRRWNGRAGVMWNISGGVFIFGPIISRVIAKGVGEGHKAALRATVGDAHATTIAKLEADRQMLENLCKSANCSPDKVETAVVRTAMYEGHQKRFSQEITGGQKSAAKARTTATQNIGAGIFVGGARVASGVLFTIPGFNRAFNGKTGRAGKVTNQDLFAAAVIGIPASTFAMLDTLRIQVSGEINRQKLKKAGMLPAQLANARLKQLDEMETRLSLK
ncbi:MAG: hypothetical protein U0103_26625 [Candidatus Obscuribacterales bacterium]